MRRHTTSRNRRYQGRPPLETPRRPQRGGGITRRPWALRYPYGTPLPGRHPGRHQPVSPARRAQRGHPRPTPSSRRSSGTARPRWSPDLVALGAEAGTAEAREHGIPREPRTTRHLTAYDRYGNRIDEVAFHPSWHWLMERAVGDGLAGRPVGPDGARTRTCAAPPGFWPGRTPSRATAARSR